MKKMHFHYKSVVCSTSDIRLTAKRSTHVIDFLTGAEQMLIRNITKTTKRNYK